MVQEWIGIRWIGGGQNCQCCVVCGEIVEKGIKGIEEASVDILRARLGAWVVDRRKSKGKGLLGTFFP